MKQDVLFAVGDANCAVFVNLFTSDHFPKVTCFSLGSFNLHALNIVFLPVFIKKSYLNFHFGHGLTLSREKCQQGKASI